jgi:alpha-D-xyloside xylohydrolase
LYGAACLCLLLVSCQTKQPAPEVVQAQRVQNGVQLNTGKLNVKVQFYADNVVRVVKWAPGGTSEKTGLVVIQTNLPDLNIRVHEYAELLTLRSGKLILQLSKIDGSVQYLSGNGLPIVKELGEAVIAPVEVAHEDNASSIQQDFKLREDEGIYGLGQHQDGHMNYRGRTVKLVQANTEAVSPFLISTRNYGILWDNYSKTVFTDTADKMSLWSEVGDNVDYYFIHGKPSVRNSGAHEPENPPHPPPSPSGGEGGRRSGEGAMDDVIAGYRDLTGHAPMYGKWAYGYWQSKEHYKTRDEVLGIAQEYRKRQIPIDNIIQDWNYWGGNSNWSSMVFDETKYPDPKGMVDALHDMNFHMMISIWPGLGPNAEIFKEMDRNGFLYPPFGWAGFKYYDAYNPQANDIYWKHLNNGLYSKGIDGWWIDSTEPDVINALTKEGQEAWMKYVGTNHLGSWARYLNPFSLAMTDDLYKNLRKEKDGKRVYILTRSTFAGQQRNAATTWSGDIGANWDVYRKQISAGVNHSMAGIPYWTFDIGGFVIGSYGGVFSNGGKDPAYRELYTRMFQLGAFCPIFRAHGSEIPREIWEFGEFSDVLVKFDNLRYRLLPYIYSLAWRVTDSGYTIMRGLPMDFANDRKTYSIDDQFMFGPAIMVCPVTEYMLHRPPEDSILIAPEHFRTKDGKPGLNTRYYNDDKFETLAREQVETNINAFWYTGFPDFITDRKFSMRWEGKLVPTQTGQHRFHMKSFGPKKVFLDGKELQPNYFSVEFYTVPVELEAGKEYDFAFETANSVLGAFRAQLFWKTPEIHAREKLVQAREKTRSVYLPAGTEWIDFWTGQTIEGGEKVVVDTPIDRMPLMVRAGSIVPMGPFVQYATEKPADPIELRIYPGADGTFTLYEDENDNYNYEKGIHSTITFEWENVKRRLTISDRKGSFPGMLKERTFNVVIVGTDHGTGVENTASADKVIRYQGRRLAVPF